MIHPADPAWYSTALGLKALGWAGNAFYFTRFFVQWLQSEKAGRSVASKGFWWMSLGGAACLGSYALLNSDTPLLVGYMITFLIYLRNVIIAHAGPSTRRLGPVTSGVLGGAALVALVVFAAGRDVDPSIQTPWLVAAFVGQAVFSSRFVVQWYVTELRGDPHFPPIFWWLSLVGNVLLLAYAFRLGDPIYIAGFFLGPFVQIRNLMLGHQGDVDSGTGDDPAPRVIPPAAS